MGHVEWTDHCCDKRLTPSWDKSSLIYLACLPDSFHFLSIYFQTSPSCSPFRRPWALCEAKPPTLMRGSRVRACDSHSILTSSQIPIIQDLPPIFNINMTRTNLFHVGLQALRNAFFISSLTLLPYHTWTIHPTLTHTSTSWPTYCGSYIAKWTIFLSQTRP